jgi:hypothetical protein
MTQPANAKRYQFLRDRFALESNNDEADFAKLAHLNGDEFDAALDAAMARAGFEVAQEVEPTGWMRDGGLLYRLGEYGSNCDEINVTMANNSRDVKARSLAASSLLRRITAPQAVNADLLADSERLNFLLANFESGWSPEDNGWYSWSYNNRGELSGEAESPPDIITCIDAAIARR